MFVRFVLKKKKNRRTYEKMIIILSFVLMLYGCSTNQSDNIDLNQETNPYFIDMEYFTVEVPESWNGLYEYEIYEDDMGYSLIFYEKDSHASMEVGYLMSISLYLESEDYSYLPSYEERGKFDTGNSIYRVLVEYPTDGSLMKQMLLIIRSYLILRTLL